MIGLAVGDTFVMPRAVGGPETWRVEEVKSKYLHLFHRILDEFEQRFPGVPGLTRFTAPEGDVAKMLEVIRETSQQSQNAVLLYNQNKLPLAAIARRLGGDPVSFANYVRSLGEQIWTCEGTLPEQVEAVQAAKNARGRGATLDPYTAWVAHELGLLDHLRGWFGRIFTPFSTLEMIEMMMRREREGLGREQMSIMWPEGQFVQHDETDEFRQAQLAILESGKERIGQVCEVEMVLLPDRLPPNVSRAIALFGERLFDSDIPCAAERVSICFLMTWEAASGRMSWWVRRASGFKLRSWRCTTKENSTMVHMAKQL